ncbi:MAG TPA: PDZ domain-containing protein [Gaiellaceae bacterium]|nr:PDZ domain-containing protein [Gaiellaceae bacterium]
MKRLSIVAVVLGALGLVTAVVLWSLPAGDFILTPDKAKPLAGRVAVEGSRPRGDGGVYYVDLYVRRIRLLERLLPFTRPEGSTVLPEHALLPPGTSDEERDRQNAEDMERSERIASVVALRALGYDVVANPRGARVIAVAADVPAAEKLEASDVIVAVDGVPVRTPSDLRQEIGKREPGDDVRLRVRRNEKPVELSVRTIQDPGEPDRPIVGITVEQEADIRLPFDVDIDLGRVGGPSAGLPFALEIARKLGRNVTHGCKIAATGELALDGTVLPIGGIKQKTIGARRAGVDFFVVPVGQNANEAQEHADGLDLIPVDSFQQAFEALTTARVKC